MDPPTLAPGIERHTSMAVSGPLSTCYRKGKLPTEGLEEYLQPWDIMAVGGRRDDAGRMTGDGRERGSIGPRFRT